MPSPMQTLAQETSKKILQEINLTHNAISADVINIIKRHINSAFSTVDKDNQKTLIKQLSLQFHPDKMQSNNPDLYHYLNSRELINEPQKIINALLKPASAFAEVMTDPVNGTTNLFNTFWEKFKSHRDISNRYPQPIRTLVKSISTIIDIALVLAVVVGTIGLAIIGGIIALTSKCADGLLNLFTNSQFNKEVDKYQSDEARQAKARSDFYSGLRIGLKMTGVNEADLNDEQLLQIYLNTLSEDRNKAEAQFKDTIKQQISITGLTKLKLIFYSIYNYLTQPLPKNTLGILGSIFIVRPLRAMLALPSLFIAAAISLTQIAVTTLFLAALASMALLRVISHVILNLPLYALDLTRHLIDKTGAFFASKSTTKPTETSEEHDSSARLLAALGGSPSNGQGSTPATDTHSTRGTAFFNPNVGLPQNNPVDETTPSQGMG